MESLFDGPSLIYMELGIKILLQNSIDIFISIFQAVQAIQVAIYLKERNHLREINVS